MVGAPRLPLKGAPAPSPPRDVTVPRDGSTTARGVLGLALKRLLYDLQALTEVPGASDASLGGYRRLRGVLAGMAGSHPGAIPSLLRRPTVAAPLRCLRDGSGDPERCLVELTAQACIELAALEALPEPVALRRLPPRLVALSRHVVVDVPPGTGEAVFEAGALRLDGVDVDLSPGSPRLHRVSDATVLAEVDTNPLAMVEAHPDKEGNAVDLGGRPAAEWVEHLASALALIARVHPGLRDEIDLFVQQVVPVGYHDERHLSASYREAIGTVYLSLHPSRMTMVEAIVHEHSHNKLNALLELDPLLEDAFAPVHRSPVRPDPRPLHGVLLAVHAFVPVAHLYERLIERAHPEAAVPGFDDRFRRIVRSNEEGLSTLLEHGRWTAVGEGVRDELVRWRAHFSPRLA